jgi:hypothetical protein
MAYCYDPVARDVHQVAGNTCPPGETLLPFPGSGTSPQGQGAQAADPTMGQGVTPATVGQGVAGAEQLPGAVAGAASDALGAAGLGQLANQLRNPAFWKVFAIVFVGFLLIGMGGLTFVMGEVKGG